MTPASAERLSVWLPDWVEFWPVPPAKKLCPRFFGPGSVAAGKPPEAPYLTAVKVPLFLTVQLGTGTLLPSDEPVPASAPGFLMMFAGAAVAADAADAAPGRASRAAEAAETSAVGTHQDCRIPGYSVQFRLAITYKHGQVTVKPRSWRRQAVH